ncbi:hypothetical protein EBU99_14735 [bacterium]|nr:hypothetical protein [bacterium]
MKYTQEELARFQSLDDLERHSSRVFVSDPFCRALNTDDSEEKRVNERWPRRGRVRGGPCAPCSGSRCA